MECDALSPPKTIPNINNNIYGGNKNENILSDVTDG